MSNRPQQPPDPQRVARVLAAFEENARLQQAFARSEGPRVVAAAQVVGEALAAGGKVLLFGNGGSAAQAQHIAAEWTGRFRRERPGLPAIALTANSSDLTAIGNDYGFDRVFARLVEAYGAPGDVAIALSTSGNSPNVLAAVEVAAERRLATIGLSGREGGKLAGLVDFSFVVPSEDTARIQELHITLLHVICDLVDEQILPEVPAS